MEEVILECFSECIKKDGRPESPVYTRMTSNLEANITMDNEVKTRDGRILSRDVDLDLSFISQPPSTQGNGPDGKYTFDETLGDNVYVYMIDEDFQSNRVVS